MEKISSLISPQETNFELVRIGGENDGGYLLPNDFSNLSACYSPGVGDIAEFELSISQKGIKCFLADASVNKSPIENENIHFDKIFLGAKTNDNKITLRDWIDKYSKNTDDLILQMDIEGDEYEVLEKILKQNAKTKDSKFDCVIGVSGGKDSLRQATWVRDKLNLRPLLVCGAFPPEQLTNVGAQNLSNLIDLGFDLVVSTPSPQFWKKAMKRGFFQGNYLRGPEIFLYSSQVQIAIKNKIKLIY